MSFENTIKKISAICASLVMFSIAFVIYLSAKGFRMDENKNIVLISAAHANVVTEEVVNKDKDGNTLNTNINLENPHFLGDENAPVTIYEYSSFGCSHCSDFHTYTLPKIKKDYIDTGKLKLIFVDFPLEKRSMQAALLSHCIEKKDYFDFLNIVFKNQKEWSLSFNPEKVFINYASIFGINAKDAVTCMKDAELQSSILNNRLQAVETFKIQGTPAFVLEHKGTKAVIHGAPSYEDLSNAINILLEQK